MCQSHHMCLLSIRSLSSVLLISALIFIISFHIICLVFLFIYISSLVSFEDIDSFHSFNHHCEPCTGSNVSNTMVHKQITLALIKVAETVKTFFISRLFVIKLFS